MKLDVDQLENVKFQGGNLIARCPACAEEGGDRKGVHLCIKENGEGPFGCVVYSGSEGAEHRKRIWALAGSATSPEQRPTPHVICRRVTPRSSLSKPPRTFPKLRPSGEDEAMTIAELREWQSYFGLVLLSKRGLLWDGDIYDDHTEWPAWIITDSTRLNAQARKYDGMLWTGIGNAKAKTLPGSVASWPIGAPEIGDRPNVILCEGQPDFCAALLVAWFESPALVDLVAPVCMTGAGHSIHQEALRYFEGKRVRIATHNDSGGQGEEAARRWAKQLRSVGAAKVSQIKFGSMGLTKRDGSPIKDLADYATLLDVEDNPDIKLFADWLTPN
jgi:hypothetical protein